MIGKHYAKREAKVICENGKKVIIDKQGNRIPWIDVTGQQAACLK